MLIVSGVAIINLRFYTRYNTIKIYCAFIMAQSFLEIDGSVLEGGGQILRNSISLSAITGIAVRVTNIRAGRSKPGLAAQHQKGIQLVADMCQAKLKGVEIGSTQIEFTPGKIRGGHYVADTKTAGSISLLLQVALPCAFLADGPVTLDLKGGTNADMAPQIDYLTMVFRRVLQRFGADFSLKIHRRGYFPKGGGHVTVEVSPVRKFNSVCISEPGQVTSIEGISYVAGVLPIKMAYEMAEGAKGELDSYCNRLDVKCYKEERHTAPDNCSGIVLQCSTSTSCVLGSDGLGKRGLDSCAVGRKAGEALRAVLEQGACVDNHSQDQMIIYMALAEGLCSVQVGEITLHTKTAVYIAETICKIKFNIQPSGGGNTIECTGLGFLNKHIPAD